MVKVEERTGMKPESETEEKPLYEKPCHCLLCGQLGLPCCMVTGFAITART